LVIAAIKTTTKANLNCSHSDITPEFTVGIGQLTPTQKQTPYISAITEMFPLAALQNKASEESLKIKTKAPKGAQAEKLKRILKRG
jgi:hypothetical protein